MAKHRILAYVRVIAALLLIGTSYMLLGHGLTGLAAAKAVFIGVFLPTVGVIYACHLLHLPLWSYFTRTLVRPILTALVPAAVLWGMVTLHRPATWASILLMGAAYSVVYAGACVHLVGLRQSARSRSGESWGAALKSGSPYEHLLSLLLPFPDHAARRHFVLCPAHGALTSQGEHSVHILTNHEPDPDWTDPPNVRLHVVKVRWLPVLGRWFPRSAGERADRARALAGASAVRD